MTPVRRTPVSKRHSAKKFARNTKTVAAANLSINPMRGGWRL